MTLTTEEVEELKNQLREQVKNLPTDKRAAAEKQIVDMSDDALESMVRQQQRGAGEDAPRREDVFRMIIEGVIPSKKIDETKDAIAVLDIRPVSRGHVIIIPVKKIDDMKRMPAAVFGFAKLIAKRFDKLKATGAEIQTEKKFGEMVINVIPVYEKSVSITSPRYEATTEELDEVFSILRKIERKKVERVKKDARKTEENSGRVLHLPRRIP